MLFVYPEMAAGGSTTSLISLLNSFDFSRYDIDLALFDRGYIQEQFLSDKVNILPSLRKYHYSLCDKCKKLFLYICTVIKCIYHGWSLEKKSIYTEFSVRYNSRKTDGEYDVVVGYLEGWADLYISRYYPDCRKIMWIHTDVANNPEVNLSDMKRYLCHADNIVCVSEKLLDGMGETFPEYQEKIISLPNILSQEYIKTRAKLEEKEDAALNEIEHFHGIKIISVCRLSVFIKGIDRMINIAKRLKDEGTFFHWYLIGSGTEWEQVRQSVDRNHISDCFIMLGEKANPYPYMKKCDILALPSRAEGKPMVVTEAQMLGLIPVVTHYASAEGQISTGEDGLISANDEESYYQILKGIIHNNAEMRKMKGKIREKDFSNTTDINEYYKVL